MAILHRFYRELSGRVLDLRLRGHGFEPHRCHCVVSLSKNINPSLVLVQPRKTCPFIALLMGSKESNQTNKTQVLLYCRYQTYSDTLKILFFLQLFHIGIVFLLLLSIPRPQRSVGHRSLGHSSFSQKHGQNIFLRRLFTKMGHMLKKMYLISCFIFTQIRKNDTKLHILDLHG